MTLGGLMNEALLEYIDRKLNDEELGRVFPVTFQVFCKTCCR